MIDLVPVATSLACRVMAAAWSTYTVCGTAVGTNVDQNRRDSWQGNGVGCGRGQCGLPGLSRNLLSLHCFGGGHRCGREQHRCNRRQDEGPGCGRSHGRSRRRTSRREEGLWEVEVKVHALAHEVPWLVQEYDKGNRNVSLLENTIK